MSQIHRVILVVLDSVGIGSLPDAYQYGDEGSHTLGHIYQKAKHLNIPNLLSLGLGHIENSLLPKSEKTPLGSFGRAMEQSAGKDTTTGHWEIAGSILKEAFPTFPEGFPTNFIEAFEEKIGRKTIGNFTASGTEIIQRLGDEHVRTGSPIVYTSVDSVFQIAMHEDIIPIDDQYKICQIARDMLIGPLAVGRVIARPFSGTSGHYTRTKGRKDFAIKPPENLLTVIQKQKGGVIGVGKISDIFDGEGIDLSYKTGDNEEGILKTVDLIQSGEGRLIFTNLVDFDMHYGHRRDVDGYAQCLEAFDQHIPTWISHLKENDVLIITADHGNDPTWHGTDHTREYIPILCYGKAIRAGVNFGTRITFADIAATIAEALDVALPKTKANSFLKEIIK